jgi:hypothetical protein
MIFRLVHFDKVVGYSRQTGGYTLYSHDLYGWNGAEISFHLKEADTGFRDRNNTRLFTNDIINMRYYRNPVALKITAVCQVWITLDKKGRQIVRLPVSGETRPLDFLKEAVSLERLGRRAESPAAS